MQQDTSLLQDKQITALRLIHRASVETALRHWDERDRLQDAEPARWQTLELTEAIDRLMDRYSARQVLAAVRTAAKARGVE